MNLNHFTKALLFTLLLQGCSGCDSSNETENEEINSQVNELVEEEVEEEGEEMSDEAKEEVAAVKEQRAEKFQEVLKSSPTGKMKKEDKKQFILKVLEAYEAEKTVVLHDSIMSLFQNPDLIKLYDTDQGFQNEMERFFNLKATLKH